MYSNGFIKYKFPAFGFCATENLVATKFSVIFLRQFPNLSYSIVFLLHMIHVTHIKGSEFQYDHQRIKSATVKFKVHFYHIAISQISKSFSCKILCLHISVIQFDCPRLKQNQNLYKTICHQVASQLTNAKSNLTQNFIMNPFEYIA